MFLFLLAFLFFFGADFAFLQKALFFFAAEMNFAHAVGNVLERDLFFPADVNHDVHLPFLTAYHKWPENSTLFGNSELVIYGFSSNQRTAARAATAPSAAAVVI